MLSGTPVGILNCQVNVTQKLFKWEKKKGKRRLQFFQKKYLSIVHTLQTSKITLRGASK